MNDEENRKRLYPQDDIDSALNNKRASLGMGYQTESSSSISENFYFKILCPQFVTGLIIGRGGSVINQLNSTCGAKIKLSQNNEFFPTTTDRIIVLYGNKDGLTNAVKELVAKIVEAPEKKGPVVPQVDMYGNPLASNRGPQGSLQIRVLIPKIASGVLIGRQGSIIKQMSDLSSCKIQLGDEADPFDTRERIVVINSSSVANVVLGVQTIMQQLLSEPKVRIYSNPGTIYGPQAPLLTGPMSGGGGYRQSGGMGPAPQVGMMVGGYPPQGGAYGMPMGAPYNPPMNMYPQQQPAYHQPMPMMQQQPQSYPAAAAPYGAYGQPNYGPTPTQQQHHQMPQGGMYGQQMGMKK